MEAVDAAIFDEKVFASGDAFWVRGGLFFNFNASAILHGEKLLVAVDVRANSD